MIVIPSITLSEAKANNQAAAARARALAANAKKHVYVFPNENHRATFVENQPGESPNDRNDRAIRRVAAWYQEHLRDVGVQVLLISDDADNRKKAKG